MWGRTRIRVRCLHSNMNNPSTRIRRRIFLPIFNSIFSRKTHFWAIKRCLLKVAGIEVGKNVKAVGPIIISNAAVLSVGDDTWLGMDFKVYGSGSCIIGKRCDIGPDVVVLTGSHEIGDKNRRAGKGVHYCVTIGSGCWIGGRSTFMGNIKIGDSSVIGASSLVLKDIDKNVVAVGNPAKEIKKLC